MNIKVFIDLKIFAHKSLNPRLIHMKLTCLRRWYDLEQNKMIWIIATGPTISVDIVMNSRLVYIEERQLSYNHEFCVFVFLYASMQNFFKKSFLKCYSEVQIFNKAAIFPVHLNLKFLLTIINTTEKKKKK